MKDNRAYRVRVQDGLTSLIEAKGELSKEDALETLVGVHGLALVTARNWLQEMELRRKITIDKDGYIRPFNQAPITD